MKKTDAVVIGFGKGGKTISGALAAMLDLGQGQGPMDHGYVLDKKD